MDTLAIVAKHEELKNRWMHYLVQAIPFKDEEKMLRYEFHKKRLRDFEAIEWDERNV